MNRHTILIATLSLALAGCGAPSDFPPADRTGLGANGRRDLIAAGMNVTGEKDGKTYAAYDRYRDEKGTGLAFAGYGCESNCTDVIRGYQRARWKKITNPQLCAAPTWGEQEGCVAFTQGLPTEISSLPPLKEVDAR